MLHEFINNMWTKVITVSLLVLPVNLIAENPILYHYMEKIEQGKITISDDGLHNYTLTAVPDKANGYVFNKWQKDGVDYSKNASIQVCCFDSEHSFKAYFADGYTITLKDRTDTQYATIFTGCQLDTMPICIPTPGYTFAGWSTIKDAKAANVTFPFSPGKDTTLYAVYVLSRIEINTAQTPSSLGISQEAAPYVTMVVKNNGVLTIESASKAEQLTFDSIIIEAGGKVVIPEGKFVATKALIMQGGDSAQDIYVFRYPQLIVNGTLNVSNQTIYYDYLLSRQQQYPLCLPIDVNIADISYANGETASYGTDFKAVYYDGLARSKGLNGWTYLSASDTKLYAGKGYTVFATPQYFPYEGTGTMVRSTYSRLRFPMHISNDYTETQKSISVTSYPSQTGKDNDAGWNLIGNPYFANYTKDVQGLTNNGIGLLTSQPDGSYAWTGTLRYVVVPSNNGRAYASKLAKTASISSFKNLFVQIGNGDAIVLPLDNRQQFAPSRLLEEDEEDCLAGIHLCQTNGTKTSDALGVLIGDAYTDQYEINADLQKFGHNEGVNLYAWLQNNELSFVAVDEKRAANAIPVGCILPSAGQYSFQLDDQYDYSNIDHVYIYDSQDGVLTDLLYSNYIFNSAAGVNNTRFSLMVHKIKTTTTANNEIWDNVSEGNGKYLNNGSMYIIHQGQVYSILGVRAE